MQIIGLLLILLGGVLAYKLVPQWLPRVEVNVLPEPGCDLNLSACSARLPGGGQLSLALAPQPIPVLKAIAVDVRLEGRAADQVTLDLTGVDMNMGLNRVPLQAVAPGRYQGQATLPVCITGGMDWQASVLVALGRENLAIPFRFRTGAH